MSAPIRRTYATNCRSCGADIWMLKTDKDKTMPVDPVPVTSGNLVVEYAARTRPGDPLIPIRVRVTANPDDGSGARHVSHFVTCPNAREHRRKR